MANQNHDQLSDVSDFDGFLLLSFGGPNEPADVVPFLRNVTRGKNIPDERLAIVGEHYFLFGGRSPINQQNQALLTEIKEKFRDAGNQIPIFWGNRNWSPYLVDTLAEMQAAGVTKAACLLTSAYSSAAGCRQYRLDIEAARAQVPNAPEIVILGTYAELPQFSSIFTKKIIEVLETSLSSSALASTEIIYVTHSIPAQMNLDSGHNGGAYLRQHLQVGKNISTQLTAAGFDLPSQLAFCSRSGPPTQDWLEPDINDLLTERAAAGVKTVVVVPIGFISDHMEVIYDLDTEAAATAAKLQLDFFRIPTPGIDPDFVELINQLFVSRLFKNCPSNCCVAK